MIVIVLFADMAGSTALGEELLGNPSETQAGLAILKTLGDLNYVDRFTARV